MNTYYRTKCKW